MAVRNRSTQVAFADEINTDGVATQKELNDKLTEHIDNFHLNQSSNLYIDGISYFWDDTKGYYLSNQWFTMDYSDNGTLAKNIYMFQKKNIRCDSTFNTMPFGKDYLIDKIQVSLDAEKSGTLFDIDDHNGNVLRNIELPTLTKYTTINNFNLRMDKDDGFRVYIRETALRRPVVNCWMRLIHEVI